MGETSEHQHGSSSVTFPSGVRIGTDLSSIHQVYDGSPFLTTTSIDIEPASDSRSRGMELSRFRLRTRRLVGQQLATLSTSKQREFEFCEPREPDR